MNASPFFVEFEFSADQGRLKVHLTADVEIHHSDVYYVVKNFRTASHEHLLPDVRIKKLQGKWVHTDSEKGTAISEAVGQAIDRHLDAHR
ncbi:MAG TPA: hypothetical protein VGR89_06860 [Puia sp.]|nr:hypothetical protein [Puia sp.]